MKESLHEAREEMKRADHLLFVSLKYTRTVDVIKSFIDRLIAALDYTILSLLRLAKEKGLVQDIPTNPMQKCALLKEAFPDEVVIEMVDFYLHLRKISRAEFDRSREYRRHVTMHAKLEKRIVEVNIDISREYFDKTQAFIDYVAEVVEGKKE